ncbi:MAG: cytochrome D1 domain-containing protein [Candidatus Methylomirabilales bacterium]
MTRYRSFTRVAAFGLTVAFDLLFFSLALAGRVQGQALYVAIGGENAIAFVDLATRKVEKFPIEGAQEPHAVALSPDRKTIYVGNAADGKVMVVDAATKKTVKVVEGAHAVCGMVWSLDGQTLYLTDMKTGRLHQFNPASQEVMGSFPVAESLCGLDFLRDGKRAFIGNMLPGGQVVVLDWETKQVVEKIPVGMMPHHVAVTPDGKNLYVTVGGEGVVAKLDLATQKIAAKIPTGGDPHAILITPDGKRGYVTVRGKPQAGESSIFVLDLETGRIVDQIPGIGPRACDVIFAQ